MRVPGELYAIKLIECYTVRTEVQERARSLSTNLPMRRESGLVKPSLSFSSMSTSTPSDNTIQATVLSHELQQIPPVKSEFKACRPRSTTQTRADFLSRASSKLNLSEGARFV